MDEEFVEAWISGDPYKISEKVVLDEILEEDPEIITELAQILSYEDAKSITSDDMDVIRRVLSKVRNPMGGYPSRFSGKYGSLAMTYVAGVGVWLPFYMRIDLQYTDRMWIDHGPWLYKTFRGYIWEQQLQGLDMLEDIISMIPWIGGITVEITRLVRRVGTTYDFSLYAWMSFEGTVPYQIILANWDLCRLELQYYFDNWVKYEDLTLEDFDLYGDYVLPEDEEGEQDPGDDDPYFEGWYKRPPRPDL